MKTLRRLSYAALGVAFTHLVFGAIVRISGSGMGCGDNWPKCYGHWFPPMNRPDLVIEWTHRLLASLLIGSILWLATVAVRKRREPGVAGRDGILRPVITAVAVVLVTAGFGAVTVFLGNPTWATVVHWTLAMTLLALLAATAIRAGALGGTTIRAAHAAATTMHNAYLAAGLAFLTVVMGGLTAKFPFGSVACRSFPGCGRNAAATDGAVYVQITHRTIAVLLVLYLLWMAIAGRRRTEATAVKRAVLTATTLGLTQIVIAAAMVLLDLPPQLRSLHEAVGVAIWLSTFTLAYLAHLAGRTAPAGGGAGAARSPTARQAGADPLPASANVRASARSALARSAEATQATGAHDRGTQGRHASPAHDAATAGHDATAAAEPTAGRDPLSRSRRDVIGAPFPTAVVGEVELIDPDAVPDGAANADAVGTAALIAAVARADANSLRASPQGGHRSPSDELSLVTDAIAALAGEASPASELVAPGHDQTQPAAPESSTVEATSAAIANAAHDAADGVVAALEAMGEVVDATPVTEPAPPPTPIADAQSAAADVQVNAGPHDDLEASAPGAASTEEAAAQSEQDAQRRPHTMAVIIARGSDL